MELKIIKGMLTTGCIDCDGTGITHRK